MGITVDLQKNKTIFIPCGCKSEVLVMEYDHETDILDCAIYENIASYINKMSFWQKIRYCYRVLVHGRPYADQIMLNRKQLKDMKLFIDTLNL
jgi:hypothetical protein